MEQDANRLGNSHLEVDGQSISDDADSSYDSASTSSTSATPSIYDYPFENGRRYHAFRNGKYIMPNDEKEQDRLDLKHHVWRLVLEGGLFRAPVRPDAQHILDVGTGTGLWAIEVAEDYPSAEVTGIDLSPIQPEWTPPNCKFVIDDAEEGWLYDQSFDLIHWRVLAGSIRDWPRMFQQAFEHTRAGGWVEAHEHDVRIWSDDDTVHKAKDLARFFKLVDEASLKGGKLMDDVADGQRQWMVDAGFINVHEVVYKVPIGPWPKDKRFKEIGVFYQAQCLEAVESISMALFTRVLGWSFEKAQMMMVGPRTDMKDPKVHVYMKFHVVYGQKPSE